MNRLLSCLLSLFALLVPAQVSVSQSNCLVFSDDFNGPNGPPDPNRWVINHPEDYPNCWWVRGRTHFPGPNCGTDPNHLPRVQNGVCVIEHHHYNPYHLFPPYWSFLGGEIHSTMEFDPNSSYRFEARVKCKPYPNGLVTSFFTYGYDGSRSDEIDFEFVSNKTNDVNYPDADPILTNVWDESVPCPNYVVPPPPGPNVTEWNTFRIYWYPELCRVDWTWLVDPNDPNSEVLLRSETDCSCVPDEPMALYFNFWAPTSDWWEAYDANLQPVSDPNENEIYRYMIDETYVAELCTLIIEYINPMWGSVIPSPAPRDPNIGMYPCGTLVTLTAEPIEGKCFKHWIIYDPKHCGDANYAVYDANNPIFVVMECDRCVTAVFKCCSGIEPVLPMMLGVLGVFVLIRRKW